MYGHYLPQFAWKLTKKLPKLKLGKVTVGSNIAQKQLFCLLCLNLLYKVRSFYQK